jgi:hypothetical protein
MPLPRVFVCCLVAGALVGCGGSSSAGVAPAAPVSSPAVGTTTAVACRTFEGYSRSFTQHANRDARAQNLSRLLQDVSTLQAAIGVALYDVRDAQISNELESAKRATDAVLNDEHLEAPKHALDRDFLMLIAAQVKIKRSCQRATQHLAT